MLWKSIEVASKCNSTRFRIWEISGKYHFWNDLTRIDLHTLYSILANSEYSCFSGKTLENPHCRFQRLAANGTNGRVPIRKSVVSNGWHEPESTADDPELRCPGAVRQSCSCAINARCTDVSSPSGQRRFSRTQCYAESQRHVWEVGKPPERRDHTAITFKC